MTDINETARLAKHFQQQARYAFNPIEPNTLPTDRIRNQNFSAYVSAQARKNLFLLLENGE